MAQKSGNIPTGRRSSVFSANSSAASSPSSSRRRKPSHATIRRRRSCTNPLKVSLNLVLKVKPMNSDREQRFSLNESFGPDEVFNSDTSKTNIVPNNTQQQPGEYQPYPIFFPTSTSSSGSERTEERTFCRSDGCDAHVFSDAKSSASRSSQDSSRKVQKTRKISTMKKPRTKSLGTSVRFRDTSPRPSSSKESVASNGVKSYGSRSSHGSLKGIRKIQTTGNRRNKPPSLLSSSSLERPRSKSLAEIPGFQPYPRPRRLSFNDSGRDEAVGNDTIKSGADKTFPLEKSFPNSLGLDDTLPVERRLSLNEAIDERREVGAVEVKSSNSRTSVSSNNSSKDNKMTVGSPYKNKQPLLTFSSLKKPRSKSHETSPRARRSSSNGSVISLGAKSSNSRTSQDSSKNKKKSQSTRYKNKRSLLNFSSLKKPRSKSLGTSAKFDRLNFNDSDARVNDIGTESSNSSIGLNDNIRSTLGLNNSVVTANIDAIGSNSSPIFNHQRTVRIGFFANNIQMAVDCVLNIRSDQKVLHVEPVQLKYEGFKIWRRPVREVQKEIEKKLAADKKN